MSVVNSDYVNSLGHVNIWQMKGADFVRNWHWVAQIITPSIAQDPERTLESVYADVLAGRIGVATLHHSEAKAAAVMLVQPVPEAMGMVFWVIVLSGQIGRGRQFLRVIRDGMAQLVTLAREAGCIEVRICGRGWHRVLRDFEPFPSPFPLALRKVL